MASLVRILVGFQIILCLISSKLQWEEDLHLLYLGMITHQKTGRGYDYCPPFGNIFIMSMLA